MKECTYMTSKGKCEQPAVPKTDKSKTTIQKSGKGAQFKLDAYHPLYHEYPYLCCYHQKVKERLLDPVAHTVWELGKRRL